MICLEAEAVSATYLEQAEVECLLRSAVEIAQNHRQEEMIQVAEIYRRADQEYHHLLLHHQPNKISIRMPAFLDIKPVRRGDTWEGISQISIVTEAGDPVVLSGSQIDLEIRREYDSPVLYRLSSTTDDIEFIAEDNNSIRIRPMTVEMHYGTYVYDLQITFQDGTVITFLEGHWIVSPDVTH